jgi:hypothetical protein
VIQATSTDIGTIIHTNDEVELLLNFKRRDLIGQNIKAIIPLPIARQHDKFIHRYFDTAKATVIDIKRELLAKTK